MSDIYFIKYRHLSKCPLRLYFMPKKERKEYMRLIEHFNTAERFGMNTENLMRNMSMKIYL